MKESVDHVAASIAQAATSVALNKRILRRWLMMTERRTTHR
jgi:hypothetical protein